MLLHYTKPAIKMVIRMAVCVHVILWSVHCLLYKVKPKKPFFLLYSLSIQKVTSYNTINCQKYFRLPVAQLQHISGAKFTRKCQLFTSRTQPVALEKNPHSATNQSEHRYLLLCERLTGQTMQLHLKRTHITYCITRWRCHRISDIHNT